ncbi:MAG: hypothetical protein B7O98_03600 [Zestosphaera tikiterensis]|uniref:HD domain-containing protein n=1 Tax=Zestosphaera tikiterensis TaxID=1973259 RepID=A0A2R7Y7L2_9CREN|nr:MAG: hypothetical protein B7O98_03600 [Zestosphaera tikiterensis]
MSGVRRKYVYDEVHGNIVLEGLELELADTPPLQRLRRVKQLSQAWYVYPGAVHVRFSHSLGVMHLMRKIAEKLAAEGIISKDDIILLKAAALLHDVGHTPYSHALEYLLYTRYRIKHEDISYWVITEEPTVKEVLSKYGLSPQEVAKVVIGDHDKNGYNVLISSDLDVDRLDYLLRDALHTGVKYGLIDLERIIQTLTIDGEGNIAVFKKGMQAAESFYMSRYYMYRTVYYHKTISAYQLLLASIYDLMLEEREVSELLRPFNTVEGIRRAVREGYIHLWDDFLIGGVMNVVVARRLGSELLRELINTYMNRKGYKAIHEHILFGNNNPITHSHIVRLREFSEQLMSRGVNGYSFRTYADSIPIISEDYEVRVITDDGTSVRISEYKDSVMKGLPRYMGIIRVYALPVVETVVKEHLKSLKLV